METRQTSRIQQSLQQTKAAAAAPASINVLMNSILDGEGMRKRFNDLMGDRAPQFISSVVSLVNADENLQAAMRESPMTVIQSALKAAMFDLPIDPQLGYAYIVPFKNSKKGGVREAQFILGYKGMTQLCIRSGVYSRIPDAIDVREGELVKYDRLTGDAEFRWIEDEEKREALPIIGYAGYFRLMSGAEKTLYMTKKQIELHERKNRKGEYMGKGWREDWDAMAKKTVIRRLIGHFGLMSIEYRNTAHPKDVAMAEALAGGEWDDADAPDAITITPDSIDPETGEIKE